MGQFAFNSLDLLLNLRLNFLYTIHVMMVHGDRAHSCEVEGDRFSFRDNLHQGLPNCMSDGQLIEDIRIHASEICNDQRITHNMLTDLAGYQSMFRNLVCTYRFVAARLRGGGQNMS